MRENCTPGSVRGAPGNGRLYRDVKYLKKHRKWDLLADPPTFANDGLTRVVPLLTGTCEALDGKKYTMLFYRREAPENPEQSRISFHWDFVVFSDGSYRLSDAPAGSQFGNMVEAMELGFVYPAGEYRALAETLKTTSMPEAFFGSLAPALEATPE